MNKQEAKKRIKKFKKRIELPYNNLFISGLIFFIIFLLVELWARIYDLYNYWPSIDIPSHFFAGIATGTILLWIVSLSGVYRKKTFVLSFTLIVAGIWELLETLEEKITPFTVPPYLRDYFFWDGFWDIILTFLGGVASLFIISLLKEKTDLYHDVEM